MGYRIGDAVRLRDGSDLRGLLEPHEDATGIVRGVWKDGETIAVSYPDPVGLHTGAVLASEFVVDLPLAAAPF